MSPFFAAILLVPTSAQAPTPSGTVLADGQPVSGATVWLHYYTAKDGQRTKMAEVRTDAMGRFAFPGLKDELPEPYTLIARAADGRFGWLDLSNEEKPVNLRSLRLDVLPVGPASGRLRTRGGQPIARRRVHLTFLRLGSRKGAERPPYLSLPDELTKHFTTTTGADGSFTLPGIPLGARLSVVVAAPGFGDPHLSWAQNQRGDFALDKAGRARIRFSGADELKQAAGLPVHLVSRPGTARPGEALVVAGVYHKTAKGAETLQFDDVVPGNATLRVDAPNGVPWIVKQVPPFVIKPGELTEVTVGVESAARVRGRVIDRKTRAGIAGVRISIHTQDRNRNRGNWTSAATGADGRFNAYVQAGLVSVQIDVAPAGHVLDEMRRPVKAVEVAAKAEHTFADIALDPVFPVEGVVVDEAGKPVPDVVIQVASFGRDSAAPPRTDARGRFVLKTLSDDEITALRVRTTKAVTNGAVLVNTAQLNGPVKLTLSEKAAGRLTGRLVDRAGKPVAGIDVKVVWHYQGVGRHSQYGSSRPLETLRTAADGRFQTTALWPGDRYNVVIQGAGFAAAQSPEVTVKAGQLHEVGTIGLTRVNLTVRGTVVDGADRPLAGVNVFNRGDGPRPLSTSSDEAGRFLLTGLYEGPAFVFARKDGYRFTMARTDPANADVRITLLKAAELPLASEQPARTRAHVAAEKKLLQYLFDKTLALSHQSTDGYRALVFECLARIDVDRARKWLAAERLRDKDSLGEESRYARGLRLAEAERAAADDLDEALTLLAPLRGERGVSALVHLAERFVKSDPQRGLRFAEEAVVRARALELPRRASSLAQLGDLVVRLGRKNAGKKLLGEAVALAAKFGPESPQWYIRTWVARHVAPHDWPVTQKLLAPVAGREDYNHYLSPVTAALARTDHKAALALVETMKADRSTVRDVTRLLIACRAAERDPAAGLKVVESISEGPYRVETLIHIAGIVADRDRKLAWSLLDRALALCLDEPEAFRGWSSLGGGSVLAAWGAARAAELHHPDLGSVVAKALACRPGMRDAWSPAAALERNVRMAKVLALVDPASARQLLGGVAPGAKALGSGYSGFEQQDWLLARCLADPARGPAFVDEALARLKEAKGERDFYQSGLLQLAQVLTAPPEQRSRVVMGLNSGIVFPDKE